MLQLFSIKCSLIPDVFATFDKERQGRVPVGMLATLLRCVGLNPSNGDAERIAQKHLGKMEHMYGRHTRDTLLEELRHI